MSMMPIRRRDDGASLSEAWEREAPRRIAWARAQATTATGVCIAISSSRSSRRLGG
jgi:hypothetical protein